MRPFFAFLRKHRSLLLFGILLTFFSSYGQTFLISLYIPELQKVFSFSSTEVSSLYAVATMASAFTLPWVGRLVDTWALRRFTLFVLVGFTLACGVLSIAFHPVVVMLGFFGLRFFGQGLMSHTSISTMARAFERDRGKAISIATLGHPLGEAILPLLIAFLIGAVGWRTSLQLSGISLIMLVVPLVLLVLRKQDKRLLHPALTEADTDKEEQASAKNPLRVFRERTFWTIAPAVFIVGFLNTAIFFFQVKLGESRGWSATWVAGSLSVFAATSALAMMGSGPLVDRLTARRLFPFMLIPFTLGVVLLAVVQPPVGYPVALIFLALSHGAGSTIKNALFAEVFGTKVIGTVRSVFTTVMVFSTALGPVTFGVLLDAGWSYSAIFWAIAIVLVGIILWSARISKAE